MKQKKDKIFVLVLGLVLANLVYYFAGLVVTLLGNPMSAWFWAILVANGIAIIGVLWLLRTYRKGRKIAKAEETQEAAEDKEN